MFLFIPTCSSNALRLVLQILCNPEQELCVCTAAAKDTCLQATNSVVLAVVPLHTLLWSANLRLLAHAALLQEMATPLSAGVLPLWILVGAQHEWHHESHGGSTAQNSLEAWLCCPGWSQFLSAIAHSYG